MPRVVTKTLRRERVGRRSDDQTISKAPIWRKSPAQYKRSDPNRAGLVQPNCHCQRNQQEDVGSGVLPLRRVTLPDLFFGHSTLLSTRRHRGNCKSRHRTLQKPRILSPSLANDHNVFRVKAAIYLVAFVKGSCVRLSLATTDREFQAGWPPQPQFVSLYPRKIPPPLAPENNSPPQVPSRGRGEPSPDGNETRAVDALAAGGARPREGCMSSPTRMIA
jgi:hypothetical protein